MTDRVEVLALIDEILLLVDARFSATPVAALSQAFQSLKQLEHDTGSEPIAWGVIDNRIAEKAEGYNPLRKRYNIEMFGAFNSYLTLSDSIVTARNDASKLITEYFYSAFVRGYEESGGSEDDLSGGSDDLAWLNDRTEAEIGYVKTAFSALKDAKKQEGITRDDLIMLAHDRADGYTDSLDMVYAEGRLRGAKNIMLTMVGDDGNESCTDCVSRKGKRYSVKKWLAIGYPPSRDFECHGYNCQHYLVDDNGKRFTP